MTIYELADILDKQIELLRYPNQQGRWMCHFKNCDVKDGVILEGRYGDGKTPNEAIFNYCMKIKGELIVFNAYGDNRTEFKVPLELRS